MQKETKKHENESSFTDVVYFSICAFAQDTPPTLTDFGWANVGTCSAAQTSSGNMSIFHPGATGLGFNWCVLAKELPAAPYTIVFGVRGHIFGKASSVGIHLYDATNGKFVVYSSPGSSDTGVASLASWKMNSFTSYAGAYYTYNSALVTGGILPKYFRIKDNGTTRSFAVSHDKEVWVTIHVVSRTDFMIPTHFGYTLRGTGDGLASQMTVFHESVTTP